MTRQSDVHLGRAWHHLAKPGPTDLHALTGELNAAANEFEIPSGPIPALDELADQFLKAAEERPAEHPVRVVRGWDDEPEPVSRVRCLYCDLERRSDERDCPRCGEQATVQI